MNEWEKAQAGLLYDANNDEELLGARSRCADLCYEFNRCRPSDRAEQAAWLRQIFGTMQEPILIEPPFYCDYGCNIRVGRGFYANHNCVILDAAPVQIGDSVFIGPNCVLTTAAHAMAALERKQGLELARPITIGSGVWLGANVSVLPGVTIGDNVVIGAGSVVNRDIPPGVVAAGNPCRVIRQI